MLAVLAVVLSCGLDTLAVAASIGLAGSGSRLRVGLVFAAFEGLMPVIGLLLGRALEGVAGGIAFAIGIGLLALVGVYMLAVDNCESVHGNLQGARVLLAGLSVSMDELAVGFSFGLVRFPIALTAALLAAQGFLFAWLGITFGRRLRPLLGDTAEKVAGITLILLAIYLGIRRWVV